MRWFKQLFQASKALQDSGIYYTVQCNTCRSVVRVRVDLRNDLSLNDEHSGYVVRKGVVDDRCYQPMELFITFDLQRKQTSASLTGGTLLQEE